jgi:DNA-binding PadR family transcriptional regulator
VSREGLTTTSYAILGLLAIKSWTTYELAVQMERSVKNIWPRAASRIYEEPKRLVRQGLAKDVLDHVGKRPRTTYSITAKGRRALSAWLAETGGGPSIECEALLKVFFAEHARREDVMANIAAIQEWASRQNAENVAFARLYCDADGPFPDRLAAITLTGKFITDFTDMLAKWAEWASETVGNWPETTAEARPDWDVLRAIADRPVEAVTLPIHRAERAKPR